MNRPVSRRKRVFPLADRSPSSPTVRNSVCGIFSQLCIRCAPVVNEKFSKTRKRARPCYRSHKIRSSFQRFEFQSDWLSADFERDAKRHRQILIPWITHRRCRFQSNVVKIDSSKTTCLGILCEIERDLI